MAGYRGDGYGAYGDHGDDDFYRDGRGRDDRYMADQDGGRGRWRDDDERRGSMFDRAGDRDRFGEDRFGGRGGGMVDRGGGRGGFWGRDDQDDFRRSGSFGDQGGDRGRERGAGFLERAGHEVRSRMGGYGDDQRFGASMGGGMSRSERGSFSGNGPHDHYLSWREQHLQELDRDYHEYCRENEHRFSSDFQSWRQNRQSQGNMPQSGSMESMMGSDGDAGAVPGSGEQIGSGSGVATLGKDQTAAAENSMGGDDSNTRSSRNRD